MKQSKIIKNSLAEKLYCSLFKAHSSFSMSDDLNFLKIKACCDKINKYLEWIELKQVSSVLILSSPSIEALCLCYALVLGNKTYIPVHRSTSTELLRKYLENYQIDLLVIQPQLLSQFDSGLQNELHEDKNSGFFFYKPKRRQPSFCLLPGIIFFTSGSYDQPKAVYYAYETLSHYLSWCLTEFQLRPDDRFLFTTEISFVASLRPLFVPALAGANLCFPGKSSPSKLQLIIDSLIKEKISILNLTPSLFKILLQHIEKNSLLSILTSIRMILLSGETLNIEDINYWFTQIKEETVFYNLYGATEYLVPFYKKITTTLEENERLDLGQLREGCNYRLLADNLKGHELYVSGEIATAYFDSQLMQNNYLSIDNCRFIKTNDFVSKRANQLFFNSRGQRSIKKYGQLINLDQLEYVLKKHHPNLNFIIYEEASRIYLVIQGTAYDSVLQPIKHSLRTHLPLYMLPDEYLFKEEIPLTISGKIDYFSIKKTFAVNQLTEFKDYFKRFFDKGEINIEARIMDLGLESIDYIAMAETFLKLTGKWLDISKINENTQIANIDSCLIETHLEKPKLLQAVTLNPIQGAVYFKELYYKPEYWLCIIASFAIRGTIDLKKMEKAIADTLEAHFILSSKLEFKENSFFFVHANKQSAFTIQTPIFFSHRRSFAQLKTSIHADRLVRIFLQKKKNQYSLVMAYHHIAIDGWSALLVREEIFRRYEGKYQKKEIERAAEISYLNQVNQAWLSRNYKFNEIKARLSSIIPHEYNQLDSFFGGALRRGHLTLILKKEEIEHFAAIKQINHFPYSVIFAYLLHQIIAKHSGTNKLFFYTSFSNRHLPVPHVKELITNLATGLPLFLDDSHLTAKEFALQIQQYLTTYFQNMSYGALQELYNNEWVKRDVLCPKILRYGIIYTYINKIIEDDYVQNKYIDWDNSINTIQAKSCRYLYLRVFNMGSHFVVFFDGNINKKNFELMRKDWVEIKEIYFPS